MAFCQKAFLERDPGCFCWVEAQQQDSGVEFWFQQIHKQQFSVCYPPHLWLSPLLQGFLAERYKQKNVFLPPVQL